MNVWTSNKIEQFKNLLKNIPLENIALVTAKAWCKEFDLKFDDNDDLIARKWHHYFHNGSLESNSLKKAIQIKNECGNWVYVKNMSTKAESIWTCLYPENIMLVFDFKIDSIRVFKMAMTYIDSLKRKNIEARLIAI